MALTKVQQSLSSTPSIIDNGNATAITIDSSENIVVAGTLSNSSYLYADQNWVTGQINNVIDSAPGALNTLNELAAAMGDDANFSTTVTNSIATKLPLAGGTMTGDLVLKSDGGNDVINVVHSGNTVQLVAIGQSSDNSGNGVIQLKRNNGVLHSQIHSHGNTYLNGGNVGIGFASGTPSAKLHVKSAGTGNVFYVESSDGHHLGGFYQESDTRAAFNVRDASGNVKVNLDAGGDSWFTGGNVMVGKTANSISGSGLVFRASGEIFVTRDGDVAGFNRLSSDGAIVQFYKDSSVVGAIGTAATDIYIGTTDTGIRFNDAVNGVLPYNTSSGQTDNTIDLGFSTVRWRDLFLSRNMQMGGNLDVVGQIGAYNNPGSAWGTMGFRATDYTFKNSGGTVKVAIDSNFDLLVGGTTTNLNVLSGTPKIQVGDGTGHASMQFYSGTSSVGALYFGDATSGGDRYSGYIEYRHNTNSFGFQASGTGALEIRNNRLDVARNSTDARITINSEGTAGTNNSNWIRGSNTVLMYNSGGSDHRWEIGGTQHMELKASQTATTPILSLTDAHPWIDLVAPDGAVWKGGITIRGGASSTQGQLHMHMTRDSGYRTVATAGNYDGYIDTTTANPGAYGNLIFATDNTEAMRIDSDRQTVFIGTTTSLNGTDHRDGGLHVHSQGGGPHVMVLRNSDTSGGANMIRFIDGSNDICGEINSHATSNTTAYGGSSDYRLKDNIVPMSGGINTVKLLQPRNFTWKSDPDSILTHGFIAHELDEVIPEAVFGVKDATERGSHIKPQMVDYGKLTPVLTQALKEAITRIETLEAEVAALKG